MGRKITEEKQQTTAFSLRSAVCSLLSAVCCLASTAEAQSNYPPWWISRGVIGTNNAVTNDYAAVNAGQLKWIAKNACDELNATIPGGAGSNVLAMVNGFSSSNNYLAVNAGQAKNVAKIFYDRLIEAGYTNAYAWPTNNPAANDYAVVNAGQVKYLFSFNPAGFSMMTDTDSDGLPDWWEQRYSGGATNAVATADGDGDGMNNIQEYLLGCDPTKQTSQGLLPSAEFTVLTPFRSVK